MLNWQEEFFENVSARSAMAFLPVILWFVTERCFTGVDCFYRLFSESGPKPFWC